MGGNFETLLHQAKLLPLGSALSAVQPRATRPRRQLPRSLGAGRGVHVVEDKACYVPRSDHPEICPGASLPTVSNVRALVTS